MVLQYWLKIRGSPTGTMSQAFKGQFNEDAFERVVNEVAQATKILLKGIQALV